MTAYYNEFDPYAAAWLRNLIAAGLIAPGDVDERSITEVRADDLRGYAQCHFFAGIGGWSYALRLAGWDDERPVWTGSCPCQPFSVAGQGKGEADERDLWPVWSALIRECRPPVVFGEQVAAAIGMHWLDRSRVDLEGAGYAFGSAVLPACAVGAPHRRDRLWFVADADLPREGEGWEQRGGQQRGSGGDPVYRDVAHPAGAGRGQAGRDAAGNPSPHRAGPGNWNGNGSPAYVVGADGKARRVEPGIRLLAHGVPARVGRLRAYGNAIVPQVAATFIEAYLDCARNVGN